MKSIRKPNGVFSWDGMFNVSVYGYDASGKFHYVGTVDWDQQTLRHYIDTRNGDYTLHNTGGRRWDMAMGKHLRTFVRDGSILVTQATPGDEGMAMRHTL